MLVLQGIMAQVSGNMYCILTPKSEPLPAESATYPYIQKQRHKTGQTIVLHHSIYPPAHDIPLGMLNDVVNQPKELGGVSLPGSGPASLLGLYWLLAHCLERATAPAVPVVLAHIHEPVAKFVMVAVRVEAVDQWLLARGCST